MTDIAGGSPGDSRKRRGSDALFEMINKHFFREA